MTIIELEKPPTIATDVCDMTPEIRYVEGVKVYFYTPQQIEWSVRQAELKHREESFKQYRQPRGNYEERSDVRNNTSRRSALGFLMHG